MISLSDLISVGALAGINVNFNIWSKNPLTLFGDRPGVVDDDIEVWGKCYSFKSSASCAHLMIAYNFRGLNMRRDKQ